MKYAFLKASDPDALARILMPVTLEDGNEPCGLPLNLGPVDILQSPDKWPDFSEFKYNYEPNTPKSHDFCDQLGEELKWKIHRLIPAEAIKGNLVAKTFIDVCRHTDTPNCFPHLDKDVDDDEVQKIFGLTATAAFPNSTVFFPRRKPNKPDINNIRNSIEAPIGNVILWNDAKHVHSAPRNFHSQKWWQKELARYRGADRLIHEDGSVTRVFARAIFEVKEEWARMKLEQAPLLSPALS